MTSKVYKNFFVLILFIITLIPNSKMTSHPLSDDFADLVEKLSPSVVNVFTVQKPKQTNNQVPFDNIPPQFRDFFKNFQGAVGAGRMHDIHHAICCQIAFRV